MDDVKHDETVTVNGTEYAYHNDLRGQDSEVLTTVYTFDDGVWLVLTYHGSHYKLGNKSFGSITEAIETVLGLK